MYRWLWLGWGVVQVLCIVMPLTQGLFGSGPRGWFEFLEQIELIDTGDSNLKLISSLDPGLPGL